MPFGWQADSATGLDDADNRWYDPVSQVFTTMDPTGINAGDPNFYRYVGNDPTNATDPSGLVETPYPTIPGTLAPISK